jgi:release factor glutamine methyltransferase
MNPNASSRNSPARDVAPPGELANDSQFFLFSVLLSSLCTLRPCDLCVDSFSSFLPGAFMSASETQIDVRTALKQGLARLREADVPSFTLAAELLLLHILGRDRTWIYAHPEEELATPDAARYFELIARRAAGEPTQHLTGKQEFWGLPFEINADVLIPRPETEHVIEVALDRLAVRELRAGRPRKNNGAGFQIADIGTGSGCMAVALAIELPQATVFATDVSPAALAVARRNAARHSVADRIHFVECNLLDSLADPAVGNRRSPLLLDLIASNPPYIGHREASALMREVRDHEPEVALYGGEEGYEFYADLIAQSGEHLKPGGILVLELGHNSLPAVQPLLDAPTWTNVGVTNDLAGIPRVLSAERL